MKMEQGQTISYLFLLEKLTDNTGVHSPQQRGQCHCALENDGWEGDAVLRPLISSK